MDVDLPDRSIRKLRVDSKILSDVIGIMSRDGRRAVVKIDDFKVDDPSTITSGDLTGATEVDVSSFWVNPDRPTFGRRHFVYFLAGPGGAKYFGDSVSPEVASVCAELDRYFNQPSTATGSATLSAGARGLPSWWPRGWLFERPERVLSAVVLGGVLIALLAFLAGRWTASSDMLAMPIQVSPPPDEMPPSTSPTDQEAERRQQ